jgi:hypothetical protein
MTTALPRAPVSQRSEETERVVGLVGAVEPAQVQEHATRPEDVQAIVMEVHEGPEDRVGTWVGRQLFGRTRDRAEVTRIVSPALLGPEEVIYPRLYRPDDRYTMTRGELVDDLETIADMGWPSSPGEPFVYGLQVIDPRFYEFGGNVDEFGPLLYDHALRAEASHGLLGHESLYIECEPGLRRRMLEALLHNAEVVRLSVQRPGRPYGNTYVTLR